MQYLQIIPDKAVPSKFLYYSAPKPLQSRQIVDIPLRAKIVRGLVAQTVSQPPLDLNLIKPIAAARSFVLPKMAYTFGQIFAHNFFSSYSNVLNAQLNFYRFLNKGDNQKLDEIFKKDTSDNEVKLSELDNGQINTDKADSNKLNREIGFYLEADTLMRIIYLIRSLESFKTILILTPENSIGKDIYDKLRLELDSKSIDLYLYSGLKNKLTQNTVRSLLSINPSQTKKIIISSRAGIFLPFQELDQIIVVEESSPFYIQEQNQLYYDTKTAAFLLANTFGSKLDFVSTTPSIRLLEMYSKEVLEKWMTTNTGNLSNSLKLQITKREAKYSQFELFSDQVGQILKPDEEQMVSFGED
jgi:primosomal protein N'